MNASEKTKARVLVCAAVKLGVLVRPESCSKCGVIPPPKRNGYPGIEAHHPDYAKPIDVQWLCLQCHREEHPWTLKRCKPSGETFPAIRAFFTRPAAVRYFRSLGFVISAVTLGQMSWEGRGPVNYLWGRDAVYHREDIDKCGIRAQTPQAYK